MTDDRADLVAIGEHAAGLVPDGAAVGLGTGHAAEAFLHALAVRVRAGLWVRGVPTSEHTAELARSLGIAVTDFGAVDSLDIAVDGADEVDPRGNLIKGYGGALVREKVVAAAARRFVVLAGAEKFVSVLGSRGKLPVEVVPFAAGRCRVLFPALGLTPHVRAADGVPGLSDNGNVILDCALGPVADPAGLDAALRAVPGVVGTGLFAGMRLSVVSAGPGGVRVQDFPGS